MTSAIDLVGRDPITSDLSHYDAIEGEMALLDLVRHSCVRATLEAASFQLTVPQQFLHLEDGEVDPFPGLGGFRRIPKHFRAIRQVEEASWADPNERSRLWCSPCRCPRRAEFTRSSLEIVNTPRHTRHRTDLDELRTEVPASRPWA